jgi:hypothetical protein
VPRAQPQPTVLLMLVPALLLLLAAVLAMRDL